MMQREMMERKKLNRIEVRRILFCSTFPIQTYTNEMSGERKEIKCITQKSVQLGSSLNQGFHNGRAKKCIQWKERERLELTQVGMDSGKKKEPNVKRRFEESVGIEARSLHLYHRPVVEDRKQGLYISNGVKGIILSFFRLSTQIRPSLPLLPPFILLANQTLDRTIDPSTIWPGKRMQITRYTRIEHLLPTL